MSEAEPTMASTTSIRRGRPEARGLSDAPWLARAIDLSIYGAIMALFLLSPLTLDSIGFPYSTPGGNLLLKLHPSTWLVLGALGFMSLRYGLATTIDAITADSGCVLLLLVSLIFMAQAVLITKTPITNISDTFILPVLFFVLLRDANPRLRFWLCMSLLLFMTINAIMGVIEFKMARHFISLSVPEGVSADPTNPDAVFDWRAALAFEWRATALLGHPLTNGAIVGSFILALLAPGAAWLTPAFRIFLLVSQTIAMFAFGARAAMVVTAGLGGLTLMLQAARAVAGGYRVTPRGLALFFLALVVVTLAAYALIEAGFLDKTLERFKDDSGSAHTRLTMLELFNQFPLNQLLLGPDQQTLATQQRLYGLEFGIESTWVGLALTYGFIGVALLLVALVWFSHDITRRTAPGAAWVLAGFFIVLSGSTGLAGKSTELALAVCIIQLILPPRSRPSSRRDPADWRAASLRR